ncbi:hypothetical protein Y919_11490 [Caloranaerobacter azorensis H53214]|uniref:Uncharacterized protein n=1 Tax=Caloranaerobacter azorensis H53214 TaxID=1156417 RepID=A0A096BFR1_9FIRM|nr:hypothetical protein [Caloranaerobacter azorensis]KGG79528.1 hypothetical protein Y919_11490 [Caloranaerobacter azorensis H53214]
MNTKKILITVLLLLIFILFFSKLVLAENRTKLIMIILDELDFDLTEKITQNTKNSVGIMNTKTGYFYSPKNEESYFLTIATGRRVKISSKSYKGIIKNRDGSLYIIGFEDIIRELKKKYLTFSREISTFGDFFNKRGIKIGYIGNDSSSLIAANINGYIEYGENKVVYEEKWLNDKSREILKKADILILSYELNNKEERIELLKKYIEKMKCNMIIFPKTISGDVNIKWNTTLVPVVYITPDNKEGLLISSTTRREGVITSLDIFPDAANLFDISTDSFIGSSIKIMPENRPILKCKNYLKEFLNLNIIKYIFHGIIIALQLSVIFSKNLEKQACKFLMYTILSIIFFSLLFGFFKIHKSIIIYCIIVLMSSFLLSFLLIKKENAVKYLSIFTNILILYGIFFNNNIIYDSFIGYNNIVAGGRFYGLNNEIMGVLLATSIIVYFSIREKIKDKIVLSLFLIIYFPLIILALSGKYGVNFGGYITSILLFFILIYEMFYHSEINKSIVLLIFGSIFILLNFIIQFNGYSLNHIGKLLLRIETVGFIELFDVIINKLKQLIIMVLVPPWSIISLGQLYYVYGLYRDENIFRDFKDLNIGKCIYIIFIGSIISTFINDTGIISFVYMNTYLIAILVSLHNIK